MTNGGFWLFDPTFSPYQIPNLSAGCVKICYQNVRTTQSSSISQVRNVEIIKYWKSNLSPLSSNGRLLVGIKYPAGFLPGSVKGTRLRVVVIRKYTLIKLYYIICIYFIALSNRDKITTTSSIRSVYVVSNLIEISIYLFIHEVII